MPLYPSDRKKLLSLPFYLAKRQEQPSPRIGQDSYELFKELTGEDWNADARMEYDPEEKITEFDYEKYLNPALIKNADTKSPEFQDLIKQLNFMNKTRYEAL